VAHTRIPIMDDAGQRPPGTIGARWAATEITIGGEPKQLELWPTAQPTTNASEAAVGREELCAASNDDSGPTRACDQRAKPRLLPMILPARASSCDPEIRAPRRDEFTLAAASAGAPWLHPALVTGALAVALGVGWIAGASSSRFFAPAPAATPIQRARARSGAREPNQEIACAAKADRQAMAGAAAKAAGPGASGFNRGHQRSRSPQFASAANKDPLTTNSIAPAATATPERAKILARPVAMPGPPTTPTGGGTSPREAGRAGGRSGGAGRYGAGNRTDRFDRALGQPLDRRDDQGPDFDPKLIFNRTGVRPSRATRRRYVWTGPNPLSALTSPVSKRLRADASGVRTAPHAGR